MSVFVQSRDVAALVAGARPFATGVNSSALHVLQDWAEDAVGDSAIEVRALSECRDDEGFAVVTIIGSPTAVSENLPSGTEPARALDALARHWGRSIAGVLPMNTAGENSVIALAAAAGAGVDLVDADGCGRVFPTIEQTMFALAGIPFAPAVIASPFGETIVIDASTSRASALIPKVVAASGGWAFFAGYPMSGAALASTANPGTVSRFLRAVPGDPLAVVPHRVLCRATILEVQTPRGDAGTGISVLLREAGSRQRLIRADADGDFFLVIGDGALLASTPDDILLVSEDGEVIDADRCTAGLRVDVVVIDVPAVWHEGNHLA
jgi:DUF917 family protein